MLGEIPEFFVACGSKCTSKGRNRGLQKLPFSEGKIAFSDRLRVSVNWSTYNVVGRKFDISDINVIAGGL